MGLPPPPLPAAFRAAATAAAETTEPGTISTTLSSPSPPAVSSVPPSTSAAAMQPPHRGDTPLPDATVACAGVPSCCPCSAHLPRGARSCRLYMTSEPSRQAASRSFSEAQAVSCSAGSGRSMTRSFSATCRKQESMAWHEANEHPTNLTLSAWSIMFAWEIEPLERRKCTSSYHKKVFSVSSSNICTINTLFPFLHVPHANKSHSSTPFDSPASPGSPVQKPARSSSAPPARP